MHLTLCILTFVKCAHTSEAFKSGSGRQTRIYSGSCIRTHIYMQIKVVYKHARCFFFSLSVTAVNANEEYKNLLQVPSFIVFTRPG